MSDPQLPPELAELERRLAGIHGDEPSPALRARVIVGVRAELRRNRRRRAWSLVAALAASVLVWVNLSLSATQATGLRSPPAAEWTLCATFRSQIRDVLPEASDREVTRQAVLLSCGSRLAHCPYPVTGTTSLDALGRVEILSPQISP